MKGNLSFSVSLLKLTVVSKVGDIDINVRKIFVTIEEDVAAILDKEQSVSLYVNEAIRFYHGNRH